MSTDCSVCIHTNCRFTLIFTGFPRAPHFLEKPLIKFWTVSNPLHGKFFRGNKNTHIFTFYVILPHWHDTGGWNPSSSKTRANLFYIVYIMGADDMATQGARASATIYWTELIRSPHVKCFNLYNFQKALGKSMYIVKGKLIDWFLVSLYISSILQAVCNLISRIDDACKK